MGGEYPAMNVRCCQVCVPWFFPFHEAKEVLDQFRDQFIEDMEAEKVVMELVHKDIISRGDLRTITRAEDPTQQNQILHLCLKDKSTVEALKSACAIIMAVRGHPKMVALGAAMWRRLETGTSVHAGVCVCACECSCVHLCVIL